MSSIRIFPIKSEALWFPQLITAVQDVSVLGTSVLGTLTYILYMYIYSIFSFEELIYLKQRGEILF